MVQPIRRVMLVDDDSTDNFLHRRILEKSGIVESVVCFERPEEALDCLQSQKHRFDVICLDLNMPRINGYDFLAKFDTLMQDEDALPAVMILSTSVGPETDAFVARYPFVVRTQSKPMTIETVHCLAEVLSERSAQVESRR